MKETEELGDFSENSENKIKAKIAPDNDEGDLEDSFPAPDLSGELVFFMEMDYRTSRKSLDSENLNNNNESHSEDIPPIEENERVEEVPVTSDAATVENAKKLLEVLEKESARLRQKCSKLDAGSTGSKEREEYVKKQEIIAPLASKLLDAIYYDGKTNKLEGTPTIQGQLKTIKNTLKFHKAIFTKDKDPESLGFWQKVGKLLMRLGNPLNAGTALFSTRSKKFHEKAKSMLPGVDVEGPSPEGSTQNSC